MATLTSGSETDVQDGLQVFLDELAPGRFWCTTRKNTGGSMIGKPVDLEIRQRGEHGKAVVAVEVANVNTTQLVGEACRLYYDTCPNKLLVLGDRNVPRDGQQQCEVLLARMYGQDDIKHTPARVVWYSDDDAIREGLGDLLLLAPIDDRPKYAG
jgi:hypothetical protein